MTTIRWRRGNAADWTTADPVLAAGEPGFEVDTGRFKVGDGTSLYSLLAYQNDVDAQIFSSDLTTPIHWFSGDAEPSVAGFTVDDRYVWLDTANGQLKQWDESGNDWVVVLDAPGPLDASGIAYVNDPYANVGAALDGLDGQRVNLDVAGHRDRAWKSATDPVDLGESPTVGDEWTNPTDGVTYDWVADTGAAPSLGEPWESLSGDWITAGTVGEARIDVLIARVSQVNDLITSALGGLDPQVLADLQTLAADLADTEDVITTLQDAVTNKVDITAAANNTVYWRNNSGVPVGITFNTIAAQTEFTDGYAPLNVAPNIRVSAYTLVLGDAKKLLAYNNTSNALFTIPNNSSVAFPTGTGIPWFQRGTGQIWFAPAAGVTMISKNSNVLSNGQGSSGLLYKSATNEWWLMGDIG
jgi:hypothetical protein